MDIFNEKYPGAPLPYSQENIDEIVSITKQISQQLSSQLFESDVRAVLQGLQGELPFMVMTFKAD
jgi:hypothetical protein